MLGMNGFALPFDVAVQITRESLAIAMIAIALAACEPAIRGLIGRRYYTPSGPGGTLAMADTLVPALLITLIFALSVMRLAEQSFSPFLYFQF